MPAYDYECTACGAVRTRIHRYDDSPPPCPDCGCLLTVRLFPTCNFKWVGTGFHAVDYHKDRPSDFNEFINGKSTVRGTLDEENYDD